LFRVPEVLDYDDAKGVAVFERIERIQPMQNIILKAKQVKPLMETLGCSLAIIHRRLTLPREMTISLPPEFDLPGTEVFLHGDFNGCNVCFETRTYRLVVLDWQMTDLYGGQATYGSRYFDIIWFVNYMIWVPMLRYLLGDAITPAVKLFFKFYFAESGISYDAEMLVRYTKGFVEQQRPYRIKQCVGSCRARIMFSRSLSRTQKFIESLKTMAIK
jgi:hypothetical protein